LRPALLRSVEEPKIGEDMKEILKYSYKASGGSRNAEVASNFEELLQKCGEKVNELYGAELDRLVAQDPDMEAVL